MDAGFGGTKVPQYARLDTTDTVIARVVIDAATATD